MRKLLFLLILFSLLCCGEGELDGDDADDGTDKDGGSPVADYMPMKAGNVWKYEAVYSAGKVLTKELEGSQKIPDDAEGRSAFKLVRTESDDPEDLRHTYIGMEDGDYVRYRKEWYNAGALKGIKVYTPYFLRIDFSQMKTGGSWKALFTRTDYDENGTNIGEIEKEYRYKVNSMDDPVDVGGETVHCVKITRTDITDGDVKTFWFADGIGKVKEIGTETDNPDEEHELLIEYTVD